MNKYHFLNQYRFFIALLFVWTIAAPAFGEDTDCPDCYDSGDSGSEGDPSSLPDFTPETVTDVEAVCELQAILCQLQPYTESPTDAGVCAEEEFILSPDSVTISLPGAVSDAGGKTINRDVKERIYTRNGVAGVQHSVIVPLRIDVDVPPCKGAKIGYEVFLGNVGTEFNDPKLKILKKVNIGGGEFDVLARTKHVALASYDKIKDLVGGNEDPTQLLGPSNTYAILIVVYQIRRDVDGTLKRFFIKDGTAQITRTIPPPALVGENKLEWPKQ